MEKNEMMFIYFFVFLIRCCAHHYDRGSQDFSIPDITTKIWIMPKVSCCHGVLGSFSTAWMFILAGFQLKKPEGSISAIVVGCPQFWYGHPLFWQTAVWLGGDVLSITSPKLIFSLCPKGSHFLALLWNLCPFSNFFDDSIWMLGSLWRFDRVVYLKNMKITQKNPRDYQDDSHVCFSFGTFYCIYCNMN